MGFFNFFKKNKIIQDEYFGQLTVMEFKNSVKYFEGRGFFKLTDSEISYLIDATEEYPTQEQRDFYKNLQDNFDTYVRRIIPLVEDEFRNWKEDFKIIDFYKEFDLVAVKIPTLKDNPVIWDMAFTTINYENHHVTIDFAGDEPTGILIDG